MRVDWIEELKKTMKNTPRSKPIEVERQLLEWLVHCHDLHNKRSSVTEGPDGHLYVSQSALARKLGVRQSHIANTLIRRGTMKGYKKGLGRLGNRNQKKVPVEVGGCSWETIVDCAKDLGRERSTIRHWLRDNPDRLAYEVMVWKTRQEQKAFNERLR